MAHNAPAPSYHFDRVNAIVAAAVWLIAMAIYGMTKAPTLSFWDCGEFIACSAILGIPHPPGSPLYILFGRIFSILPLAADIAVRVNLLSAVSSAFSATFGYLVAVRILRTLIGERARGIGRAIIYGGAVTGALLAAFSLTNWNNSVETEVYGLTMALMLCIVWLSLIYFEFRGTALGERIMLLIIYIAILGVGVHMTAFMALPIVTLFFILRRETPSWAWFAVAVFFVLELYLIISLSSLPGEIPFYIPMAIVAVLFFLYIFSFENVPRTHVLMGLGFAITILPLLASVLTSDNSAARSAVEVLSITAFVVMVLGSGYLVREYLKRRRVPDAARVYMAPAGFVAAALVMVAISFFAFEEDQLPQYGYQAFLVATVVLALGLGYVIRRYIRWEILLAVVAASTLIIGVKPFIFALVLCALVLALLGLTKTLPGWRNALLVLLVAVIGFSINAFIPIRARQAPAINENNSTTISKTIDFLDRKQYGKMSMVERMFKRRGEWGNQFGNYRRMGFWNFFSEQYGSKAIERLADAGDNPGELPGLIYALLVAGLIIAPVLIGIFGIWELVRRKPRIGLIIALLILLTSVGLVLYMNFADGTRQHPVTGQDYLEVRERDYFFTPAFMLFGLSIGIGTALLVNSIREFAAKSSGGSGNTVAVGAMVLFLAPVITIAGNYHFADRSGNMIPYDYGNNLLNSASENAILFTHGDNDTFPLWCLQEVYGLRPDLHVVNLSLSNTHWYIRQLRSTMGMELPWTDEQIGSLVPHRNEEGVWYRPQDMVVDALMDRYYGERPIYFSVTVGSGARRYQGKPIDERLTMTGLLFEVREPSGRIDVDVERSLDFFHNEFRARGVADPDIYKDEATERLTRNYGNAFLMVADTLRRAGRDEEAERLISHAWNLVPYAGDLPEFLAAQYSRQGRTGELESLLERAEYGDREYMKLLLARAYTNEGDTAHAAELMTEQLRNNPTYRRALDELMRLQFAARDLEGMRQALRIWVQANPDDREVSTALRQLEAVENIDDLFQEGP